MSMWPSILHVCSAPLSLMWKIYCDQCTRVDQFHLHTDYSNNKSEIVLVMYGKVH